MNFEFDAEQQMLADQIRRMLEEKSSPLRLLELQRSEKWDQSLWLELGEMGFLGANIAEKHDGLGLSEIETAIIVEELGRTNAALPFISSLGLAAEAIRLAGNDAQQSRWLPSLASGKSVATFAYAEGRDDVWSASPQCRWANGKLNGEKWPVADLREANIAVVACHANDMPALALIELSADGVTQKELESFDKLRSHGSLLLQNAPAELLNQGDVTSILSRLLNRAAVLTAFEQIGGAEACLYMARDYAMDRLIFNRPLASFQAIKHKLADILVLIELARSNAYFAAWALVNDAPELDAAAAAARLSALDAFEQAARENLHIHGGIGYTSEAPCHFYYRRERLLAASLHARHRWSRRLIDTQTSASTC